MTLETMHNPIPMLICTGFQEHTSSLPDVRGSAGATGPVICTECGEPMALVDLVIVRRASEISWSDINYERQRRRRYWS